MRLRTAAVDAVVDGKRVGGPWAIPLDRDALKEIKALEQEFGRVTFEREEPSCGSSSGGRNGLLHFV